MWSMQCDSCSVCGGGVQDKPPCEYYLQDIGHIFIASSLLVICHCNDEKTNKQHSMKSAFLSKLAPMQYSSQVVTLLLTVLLYKYCYLTHFHYFLSVQIGTVRLSGLCLAPVLALMITFTFYNSKFTKDNFAFKFEFKFYLLAQVEIKGHTQKKMQGNCPKWHVIPLLYKSIIIMLNSSLFFFTGLINFL